MANIKNNTLYIKGALDLEAELFRYNCQTLEELEQLLNETYNTSVVYENED